MNPDFESGSPAFSVRLPPLSAQGAAAVHDVLFRIFNALYREAHFHLEAPAPDGLDPLTDLDPLDDYF